MQEEGILDKKIIQLTNYGAKYYNNSKCDLYIDISEPIKNVSHIKILKSSLRINITSLNDNPVVDNDPIYISINDYNRINTIINTSNVSTVYKSFEVVNLNITTKYLIMANSQVANFINFNGLLFENIYSSSTFDVNDTTMYNVIPHDPSLMRFNIKIYDKYHDLINIEDILNFEITLCVFSNNKKITMR